MVRREGISLPHYFLQIPEDFSHLPPSPPYSQRCIWVLVISEATLSGENSKAAEKIVVMGLFVHTPWS